MAAIFDMDGLLLDTEPLWGISMLKIATHYQVPIRSDFFKYTTGLRIYEVTEFWKEKFGWPGGATPRQMAEDILDDIIALSKKEGSVLPGVITTLEYLKQKGISLGVATSSPTRMMNTLISHFNISHYFNHLSSAETTQYGKPHPEVYLQCAAALNTKSWHCIAFEDSLNGVIAAKAARMKVVAVPEAGKFSDTKFGIADQVIPSLEHFNPTLWSSLQ